MKRLQRIIPLAAAAQKLDVMKVPAIQIETNLTAAYLLRIESILVHTFSPHRMRNIIALSHSIPHTEAQNRASRVQQSTAVEGRR